MFSCFYRGSPLWPHSCRVVVFLFTADHSGSGTGVFRSLGEVCLDLNESVADAIKNILAVAKDAKANVCLEGPFRLREKSARRAGRIARKVFLRPMHCDIYFDVRRRKFCEVPYML